MFLDSLSLTNSPTLFFISFAALLVKVNDKIEKGSIPCEIKYAILKVSTRVLPDPAPATIIMGPSIFNAAFFCESFKELIFDVKRSSNLSKGFMFLLEINIQHKTFKLITIKGKCILNN